MEAEGYARGWVPLLVLLLWAFGVFGLWSGCNAVLLADLSRALGLSPGPLGAALFAGAASSIAAMASLGWAADRLGRKAFLVGALCLFGIGIAGLALVGNFWALLAVVVLVFSAGGLYDVGINAAAVDLEGLSGRRYMSFLHAAICPSCTPPTRVGRCWALSARGRSWPPAWATGSSTSRSSFLWQPWRWRSPPPTSRALRTPAVRPAGTGG